MIRNRYSLTACLIAGVLICGSSASAFAQSLENAGVVRVSDSSSLQPVPAGSMVSGGTTDCPPGGSVIYSEMGYGAHSGYRFSPPVKRPIYRTPVSYTKGFPDSWTGQNFGPRPMYRAPTVYMPTDTTQLGYYYQHVPYWQPKPGAVPPPPVPSQWHTTIDQVPMYGHHPAGKIYGTAPTIDPYCPEPLPWGQQGVPPAPTPAPAHAEIAPTIQSTGGTQDSTGLERSDSSPILLPITN